MGMKKVSTFVGLLASVLIGTRAEFARADLGQNCAGGGGPPPCNETIASLGQFRIYLDRPEMRVLFQGYPGYNPTTFRLESPVLYDPATSIGRSVAFLDGSATDLSGVPVGSPPINVADSNLVLPPWSPPFGGGLGAREIHTELRSLNLTTGSGASVRAGAAASARPRSFGEVESLSGSGNPANDFPADSFFDVFVEVDIPGFGSIPNLVVYNQSPLIVRNSNVMNLPPQVVYIHGGAPAVPIVFRDDDPVGPPRRWWAGQRLGWLVLAGHGADMVAGQENLFLPAYQAAPEMAIVPTVTSWGLLAMVLLLLSAGTVVVSRRRGATGS